MAQSEKRIIFGVHSFTPYSRSTGMPYGIVRCLKSSTLNLTGELIDLNAGSNKYPWASEESKVNAEMNLKVAEYPAFLFELFLGKAPTESSVDAAGSISTPVEVNGTNVIDGTNGISTITVIPTTGAANLKFGKYAIIATDSTHIDIYMLTDVDATRGTDVSYETDALKITASPLEITASTNDHAATGLRFTGVGTPAFTTGATVTFEVKPPSTRSMEAVIGASGDSFPEFGALVVSQKRGNNEFTFIDAFKCKGAGMPLGFEENAYSESDIKVKLLYDSAKNGVFKIKSSLSSS